MKLSKFAKRLDGVHNKKVNPAYEFSIEHLLRVKDPPAESQNIFTSGWLKFISYTIYVFVEVLKI